MKFLSDKDVAHKVDYDGYSQYAIWRPNENISDDGLLRGHGISVTVIHPTDSYSTYKDYNCGDYGWDRLFNSPKYSTGYGISNGVGRDSNQLILFNIYNTYSIWRSVYSHTDYRTYLPCMLGLTYLDMIYRFGSKTVIDSLLSEKVLRLIDRFHESKLGNPPNNILKNENDIDFNYDEYLVELDPKKMVKIDENYLYFAYMGFKYEMARVKKIPADLESPRWWRQAEGKTFDLSDIICDNQMVLF